MTMVTGIIPNFDSFAWAAVGLFVAGLLGVMVYEKSSSKAKRQQRQTQSQRQQSAGTNPNVEPE
jgi:Na+/glutamate symporter